MSYEPRTIANGSVGLDLYELAPGVEGYAIEHDGRIYIPVIKAKVEGSGDVGRFIDSLSPRCVFSSAISPRLQGMLMRRGFTKTMEVDSDFDEPFDVWVRAPDPGASEDGD